MINVSDSKAPHGMMFTSDTKTAPNTRGRVATEEPKNVLLGNAEDGSVMVVDLNSKQSTQTVAAPSTAKLAICGMQMGPDGKIYISSMGDGKVYPFDGKAYKFAGDGIGGGDATQSVCGIAWTADGKTAYITVRHEPVENESSIFVYDVEKDQVIDRIPGIPAPLACGLILAET